MRQCSAASRKISVLPLTFLKRHAVELSPRIVRASLHGLAVVLVTLLSASGRAAEVAPTQPETPPAEAAMLPELAVGTAKTAPRIDGTLVDPAWKDAATSDAFKLGDGSAPRGRTKLYMMKDDKNLYLAVECFDSEETLQSLKATAVTHEQDGIWEDDAVELFIDPNNTRVSYYQIIVNSKSVSWDGFLDSPGRPDRQWQPKAEVQARVGKESWIVTLALPYASFDCSPLPASGTEWAFNVSRNRTAANELMYWSPVFAKSSHTPEKFGRLTGMPAGVVKGAYADFPALGADATAVATANSKTRAEVEALIASEGTSPPQWWNAVTLNIPDGLDLTWQGPKAGEVKKTLAQYLWSTVNENPAKWKEGIKLLHHSLTVNRDNSWALKQSMNALGAAYAELLLDFPRAAFWWRKGGGAGHAGYSHKVALARCYLYMGNRDMAVEALGENNVNPSAIPILVRVWGELGETARALQLGERNVATNPIIINQVMGEVCRRAGQFPEAIAYFEKSLNACKQRQMPNTARLQNSLESAQAADAFNHLERIPDGSYTASSLGYTGPVGVTVDVKNGKLDAVKVSDHHEKQYYSSITETPAKILQKQSIKGVDITSGATITSEAIINAAAKALVNATKQ